MIRTTARSLPSTAIAFLQGRARAATAGRRVGLGRCGSASAAPRTKKGATGNKVEAGATWNSKAKNGATWN